MKILLPITVPSDNVLWQGRRFKTKRYKDYTDEALWLLQGKGSIDSKCLEVHIVYYWHNWMLRDVSNAQKSLLDILAKAGTIVDDRYIMKLSVEKRKQPKDLPEKVELNINELTL